MAKPKELQVETVFNKAKVSINFDVLDSDGFKNLEPFAELKIEFVYKASNKKGQVIEGKISAESAKEAENILKESGLSVNEINEVEAGRENPFAPSSGTTTSKTK